MRAAAAGWLASHRLCSFVQSLWGWRLHACIGHAAVTVQPSCPPQACHPYSSPHPQGDDRGRGGHAGDAAQQARGRHRHGLKLGGVLRRHHGAQGLRFTCTHGPFNSRPREPRCYGVPAPQLPGCRQATRCGMHDCLLAKPGPRATLLPLPPPHHSASLPRSARCGRPSSSPTASTPARRQTSSTTSTREGKGPLVATGCCIDRGLIKRLAPH